MSAAYGSLLSHLFAQLEAAWRGEVFNVDVKTVQLCLLKRILKNDDYGTTGTAGNAGTNGNLVIWTAALKEIRMLSTAARELASKWVLKRCQSAESDWPVIFHNLLLMCSDNRVIVFEGLYGCLEKRPSAPLMDHLIFLIGQDGALGKSWIKWTLARGCFKIAPIVFSGLLSLSEDVEYFHVLGPALLNNVKLMQEIWIELCSSQCSTSVTDPVEYLRQVSKWIGSECEAGIRGALRLIGNMRNGSYLLKGLSESFFIELYKLYPFARRELLKSSSRDTGELWKKLYQIDEITLKDSCMNDDHVLDSIIKTAPELLKDLIDHEDQIHSIISNADVDRIRALIGIESILLKKALKSVKTPFDLDIQSGRSVISEISDWREITVGEISAINFSDGAVIPRLVELCELLQVPGALDGGTQDILTDLAIDFVSSEAGEGVFSVRERISLISKLVTSLEGREIASNAWKGRDFAGLLRIPCEWNSHEGTLKYLLERISVYSPEFNSILPKIPVKIDFQVLISQAICRMGESSANIPLTNELLSVIGGMAGRVVSEPQLVKPFMSLLSIKKYQMITGATLNNVQKFSELSDPNLIRSVVEFAMEYDGIIDGIGEELIKSIIMFYGIIEDGDSEETSNPKKKIPGNSKFKHLHLSEKSVNFAVMALLTRVQGKLSTAHKLLRHCPEIYTSSPGEFIGKWVIKDELVGMTKGLISGKAAGKLHTILASFYDLITRLLQSEGNLDSALKELTGIVGSQLNRQVYALIPLQQEKMQNNLKQELNLKKSTEKKTPTGNTNAGKSVTGLVFAMEKFEETLIKAIETDGPAGWCEKIVRSTARDFKIRLEQL